MLLSKASRKPLTSTLTVLILFLLRFSLEIMADVAWIAAIVVPVASFLLGAVIVFSVYWARSHRRKHSIPISKDEAMIGEHSGNTEKAGHGPYKSSTVIKSVPYKCNKNDLEPSTVKMHSGRSNKDSKNVHGYHHSHHDRSGSKSSNYQRHHNTQSVDSNKSYLSKPVRDSKSTPSTTTGQELKWYNPLRLFKSEDDEESLRYSGMETSSTRSYDSRSTKQQEYLSKKQQKMINATSTPQNNPYMPSGVSKTQNTRKPNHFTIPIVQQPQSAAGSSDSTVSRSASLKVASPLASETPMTTIEDDYIPRLSVQFNRNSSLLQQMNLAFDNDSIPSIDSVRNFNLVTQQPGLSKASGSHRNSRNSRNSDYLASRSQRNSMTGGGGFHSAGNSNELQSPVSNGALSDPAYLNESSVSMASKSTRSGRRSPNSRSIQHRRSSLSHRSIKSAKSYRSTTSSRGISNIYQLYGDEYVSLAKLHLAVDKPLPEEPSANPANSSCERARKSIEQTSVRSGYSKFNDAGQIEHPVTPPNRSPMRSANGPKDEEPDLPILQPSQPLRVDYKKSNSIGSSSPVQLSPFESPVESEESPSQISLFTAKTSPSDMEVQAGNVNTVSPESPQTSQKSHSLPEGIVAVLGEVYRVVHPYQPEMEDELELRRGEKLIIFQVFDDGWCFAKLLVSEPEKFPSARAIEGICPKACLASL